MDRNLALNLARVTEAAALSAGKWLGKGDKNAADGAAVDAMRRMFDTVDIDGTVVIGEGEIDEAPMLYIGEKIGTKVGEEQVDIAVDPIDGTNSIANGMDNSIAVLAVAPKGCLLNAPDIYMDKIACGPKAKGLIKLDDSPTENIKRVARALNKNIDDIVVAVLDRPRHEELIKEIISIGARVKKVSDGDVVTAIETCYEDSGVDLVIGRGGAPEGVIAAAALKCLGGDFQGRLHPTDEKQEQRCRDLDSDLNKIYSIEDLVKGNEVIFSVTGITSGEILEGVKYYGDNKAKTDTLVLRLPSGTQRFIKSIHSLDMKPDYAK
ncbi:MULTISPECIES: class II fructose-bisphosphatase [Peptoniphilus]|uniref:class II fructose-bisphosphatase n=1 Tax=Peptoniphilus TaxID=162289 RepID=UPI000287F5F0|nr:MULTISPECIES: class II fructose-bisphosphatase [Peptoniphilus]MBS6609970.1 class II fructose-bisphosphatase [Peptoniphilus harei]MDU2115613.1 class II fructose-bisphosphatase [Peptoniphilus lacydonensis]MDU5377838.1 class II fructose-bisphosphatase [Peptoniphilus lacydonensis]MDU5437461.1 class II fructose-bisphosphatase [Peptoniphilus lacydonensis]MDU7301705.1 class II fructose-bisphosphatase [Peptoniphilus lacydonensis]